MSMLVIVNESAARARRALPVVREALKEARVRFDVCEPRGREDTEAKTRAALGEGFATIAVVGGDGTLSAAASGFFERFDKGKENRFEDEGSESRFDYAIAENSCDAIAESFYRPVNASASLAILPAGTGDDFARGLTAGSREPLAAWIARLVRHAHAQAEGEDEGGEESVRRVDLLSGSVDARAHRFLCLNAATLGIGAEVAARVAKQGRRLRRMPGEARFALAALASLAAWRDRSVSVRVDEGERLECRTNILAVANGAYAGGGMNLSPHARPDDGRLDALTACGLAFPEILRELSRVHSGGHLNNRKIKVVRGERVRIETIEGDELGLEADGDVRGCTPAEFSVMPLALRVVF